MKPLPLMLPQWLGLSVAVSALDLYTKHLVQNALTYGEHVTINAYFDLVLFHNQGAAFSFLAGEGGWQRILFSLFAIIASGIIVHLLIKHPNCKLFCFALSLVLGGALGNLWDRISLGYVVDFLYFHYHQYDWPAFNIADSAICVGVALLLWEEFKKPSANV